MSEEKGPSVVPDLYVNAAKLQFSLYDLVLEFGLKAPGDAETVQPLVVVRMSPQHAKVFAEFLVKQLAEYETKAGPIPSQRSTTPSKIEK